VIIGLSSCAFRGVIRSKNIVYLPADPATHKAAQQLNVFAPRHHDHPENVFIFIHGGNWNSGKKSLYNFFGNRLARKGVVAVIIDYPLSPGAKFNEMTMDAALSVKWVKENIERYGGDPNRIFISGHSAGGQLAALITVRKEYFDTLGLSNPLKGTILIDAAGLDQYGYMLKEKFAKDHTYSKTFTTNPMIWKEASALYYLRTGMPPMLIYRGGRTYPSIRDSNEKFAAALKKFVQKPDYHILPGKRHVPMITQFFKPWNPRYEEILNFMEKQK
jgi:acetyl esterase/lipase